jgi:hypothetical protein
VPFWPSILTWQKAAGGVDSNSLVAISIVNGAHVVCIGSWYAITMLDALLNQQQHLRPEVQRALLQAVGCVAVLQTQWHANTELSLKHLLSR